MKQQRNTKQRKLVLEAVRTMKDHPTADMIYAHVRQINEKISRGTVYRNLNLLVDRGDLIRIDTQGAAKFDHRVDSHDHIICRECGALCDTPPRSLESIKSTIIQATGYKVINARTNYEGICPSCLEIINSKPKF